ncbi:unnamed protein product [Closterium sp. NIES-64]|nr:unnamed protein product [Closterium sp. NIES-64]
MAESPGNFQVARGESAVASALNSAPAPLPPAPPEQTPLLAAPPTERTVTGKLRGAGCPVAILLLKGAQREKQLGVGAGRPEGVFFLDNECWEKEVGSGSRITSTSHRLSLPHQSHRPLSPASHAALTSPPLRTHLSLPRASASLLISSLTFSAEHSSLLFTCLPHPPSLLPPHSPPSTPPLPSTPPSPSPSPSPCLPLPLLLPLPVPLPLPLPFPLSPSPPQSITDSKALHRQYLRHHVLLAVPAAPPIINAVRVRQLVKRAARILRRKLRRGKKGVQQLVRRRLFLLR